MGNLFCMSIVFIVGFMLGGAVIGVFLLERKPYKPYRDENIDD